MGRLIDTKELEEAKWVDLDTAWGRGWNAAIDAILEAAPTVDAVVVVRCKDCRYCDDTQWCEWVTRYITSDGFCAWGERRENG